MYSTDPIADMLSRIRNAIMANRTDTAIPYSKLKAQIADILVSTGFIDKAEVTGEGKDKVINLILNDELNSPRITEIKRVSKPGRRVYKGSNEIPVVKNGRGLVVVSTSQGLMTGHEAKKAKVGGEVLCSIY